jgi:hypothetical protein
VVSTLAASSARFSAKIRGSTLTVAPLKGPSILSHLGLVLFVIFLGFSMALGLAAIALRSFLDLNPLKIIQHTTRGDDTYMRWLFLRDLLSAWQTNQDWLRRKSLALWSETASLFTALVVLAVYLARR